MISILTPLLSRIVIAVTLLGTLGFGMLTAAVMDHTLPTADRGMAAESHTGHLGHGTAIPGQTEPNPAPDSQAACVGWHVGLLEGLSQALPGVGIVQLLVLAIIAFAAWTASILLYSFVDAVTPFKHKYRYLFERIQGLFALQPYYWLAILEKRDPAYAIATV